MAVIESRAQSLFVEHRQKIFVQTDRLFAGLMIFQWIAGIVIALIVSPKTWIGAMSQTHVHVWAAIFLGGAIASVPIFFVVTRPGEVVTRYMVAVAQMLFSALLIHLTGGRIETHFHVFGSLAFLAFYRDWKVLIPATIVVAADHFLRGTFWPQSVFGVLTASPWRWIEHAAWVVFENIILVSSCLRGTVEMRQMAERTAQLEENNQMIEVKVKERTHEFNEARIDAQRAEKEIRLIQMISSAIYKSDDFYSALNVVLKKIGENVDGVWAEAWIPDSDGEHLRFSQAWSNNLETLKAVEMESKSMKFALGKGLPGRVRSSLQPSWIQDVTLDKNFLRVNLAKEIGVKAAVAVPIVENKEAIAVVCIFLKQALGKDDRLVQFISTVTNQLGAIVKSRQAEEERKKAEIQIKKQALEAKLLYEITKMSSQTDSLTEALQGCVNTICQLASWPVGHIYILSENGTKELKSSKIWFIAKGEEDALADFKKITEETNFVLGVGLPGRIWESGEPAWIRNVQEDGNFPRITQCKEKRIKGAFGFPIKVKDKTMAVAEFFTNEEMELDENLLTTVRSVGEQLGRVIERKQAEKDIGSAQAQLLQSEKLASIGQLAAGVAHEINNPVGFISNNMELLGQYVSEYTKILRMVEGLKKSVEEDDLAKAKNIIKDITKFEEEIQLDHVINDTDNLLKHNQRGIERIQKIVMDLKTFAREDTNMMELVKVEEIIDSILSIVHNELKYKAELKKNYAETPLVKCNPQRLGQVFINLLVNATHAIEEKGTIEIKTYQDGQYLCIDVRDTGKGIPPENLKKIFDAFFTTKPVGQGTGLGLSVSYEIVKKHGGDIKVQSVVGEGTTFTVMLPINNEGRG